MYGLNDVKCPSLHEPLTTLHSNIVLRVGNSNFQLLCPIVRTDFCRLLVFSASLLLMLANVSTHQRYVHASDMLLQFLLETPLSNWGVSTDWITGVDVSSWTARIICSAHGHDISSNVTALAMTTTSLSSKPFSRRSSDADSLSVAISGWSLKVQQTKCNMTLEAHPEKKV